jgi:hypothetical protein
MFSAANDRVITMSQPALCQLGQVRDIKHLHSARYDDVMIVARNNEPLLFFTAVK